MEKIVSVVEQNIEMNPSRDVRVECCMRRHGIHSCMADGDDERRQQKHRQPTHTDHIACSAMCAECRRDDEMEKHIKLNIQQ